MIRILKRRRNKIRLVACACFLVASFYGVADFYGFVSYMFAATGGGILVAAWPPRRPSKAEEERSIRFLLRRAARKGNSEFRYCTNIREAFRLGAAMQRRAARVSHRAD